MSSPGVTDRIHQLIRGELNIEVPSVDTDLIESSLLDSLSLVELIALLEEELGIEISLHEVDIDSFRSIRRIGELIAPALEPMQARSIP
jgi:acyl carrier protein